MSASVLVVDDDGLMRTLIRRTLVAAGYQVWTAASVAEARRLLPTLEDQLDLVLTDVVMPGGLGPDVAAGIGPSHRSPRVAYMSSYSDTKLRAHGIDLGGAPFLPKPFMPATLLTFVSDTLG